MHYTATIAAWAEEVSVHLPPFSTVESQLRVFQSFPPYIRLSVLLHSGFGGRGGGSRGGFRGGARGGGRGGGGRVGKREYSARCPALINRINCTSTVAPFKSPRGGGGRGRGRGGMRGGMRGGKKVIIEPHRHEGK